MSERGCPSSELLTLFSQGNLSESQVNSIADHLRRCARCDQELSRLDAGSDPLMDDLRQVAAQYQASAVRVSESTQPRQPPLDSQEMLLDPGRRLSQRLVNGPCHVGKFELHSELGSGSFGYVFQARDGELDRTVALKVQRAGNFADAEDVQRFVREARSAARLKHPFIVSIYESGQTEEGFCYLASEYVDGMTLEQLLKRGPLEPAETARFTADLADALDYAHRQGIVHRDIKPSNILIDHQRQVHLTDFGLAKRMAADDTVTHDGQVMGTPAYMSPEQAKGESHNVDARTDVYSLGAVMFQMLCGERPFQAEKRMLLLQVMEDDPRPPRQLNDAVPRDLEVICLKAMSKLPRQRYSTAGLMSEDLRRYLDGRPILARPAGYGERLWRWCRRYPLAVAAFAAILLGSLAGLVYQQQLSRYFVEQTALDSAAMQAEMLDTINAEYSNVVKNVDVYLDELQGTRSRKFGIIHDPLHPVVPVPAKFTMNIGDLLAESETGMQVRLYSNYPWRERAPLDQFGRRAIEQLERNPTQPVVDFTEIGGRPVVRFATARIMSASCIGCHNYDKASPKTDWNVGDVRGVLEVIRPLDRDIQRTRRGLSTAFTWMGIVSGILVVAGIVVFAIAPLRKRR